MQKQTKKASEEICEKLYSLISNVLFIADRDNPEMYHPRIGVQNDSVFRQLSMKEQEAFNRLYNHYYYERHNEFWYHEAMKKLPVLLQATPMLVCGEDLGMVPGCVPWVMNQLQILSLEIQRMPKKTGIEFGKLDEYPYLSVCTIGTHDMTTLRGWWKENPEQTGTSITTSYIIGESTGRRSRVVVRRNTPASPAMPVYALHPDVARLDFNG